MICDQLDQRAQQPRDVAEPFGELAAIDVETAAGVDLGLPIERKVVAELGDRDVGEEARVHHAARDRQVGHRCLHHRLALAARARRPHMADHLEAAGNVGETSVTLSLTLRSSVPPQVLHTSGRRMHDIAARQLGRQLAALLLLSGCAARHTRRSGLDPRSGEVACGQRRALGLARLCLLQRQLELLEGALDALRARAELLATELGELRLQLLDGELR